MTIAVDLGRKATKQTNKKSGSAPSGIFLVFSGAEMKPHSQWNLGAFFPILKKNPDLQKKNIHFFEGLDFHSVNTYTRARTYTHTSYMVTFSFNILTIVCLIANVFLLTKIT